MKSLELRLSEAHELIKQLEKALALQRSGYAISTRGYQALREDALMWLDQNRFVEER